MKYTKNYIKKQAAPALYSRAIFDPANQKEEFHIKKKASDSFCQMLFSLIQYD